VVTEKSELVTGLDVMCVGKHTAVVVLDMAIVYSSV
jgi:hypothetical protein